MVTKHLYSIHRFLEKPIRICFLILFLLPLIELYLMIKIGNIIGAMMTIVLVICTTLVGMYLLKFRRLSTIFRSNMRLLSTENGLPTIDIIENICVFIAASLLLTPGFITDTLGLILFAPWLRRLIIHKVIKRRAENF